MSEVIEFPGGTSAPREYSACPCCRAPESVHASHHPSGAWLLLCGTCEWHEVIPPSGEEDTWVPVPRGSTEWVHGHLDEPAPDGVSILDLRP
jgi:hypothetical protein